MRDLKQGGGQSTRFDHELVYAFHQERILQSRGRACAEVVVESIVQGSGASNAIRNVAYSVQQRLPGSLSATSPAEACTSQVTSE
jgi:hypothetical protein